MDEQELKTRNLLAKAMAMPESFAIEMVYEDSKGKVTKRTISPTKFIGHDLVAGLCLSRQEPRTFKVAKCFEVALIDAANVLAPVPIEE